MAAIRFFRRLLALRLCLGRPHRGISRPGPVAVALPLLFARLIGPRLRLLDGDLYRFGCCLDRRLIVARRIMLPILRLILARMPVAAAAIAAAAGAAFAAFRTALARRTPIGAVFAGGC